MAFFPPIDASDAISNWIRKPQQYMEYCDRSENNILKNIAKLDWIVTRLAVPLIACIAAMMDCYYQCTWLTLESGFYILSPLLSVSPKGRTFVKDITFARLKIRIYKAIGYAVAISGSSLGFFSPPQLVRRYEKHELILPVEKKEKTVLEKVGNSCRYALDKANRAQEIALQKMERGGEFLLQHRGKISTAASISAATAFILNRL